MKDPGNFLATSGNRCSIEPFVGEVFVSLVDYRNSLFTSVDPKKIIEFYKGFENREQLIQWMKERPKGVAHVREVEGDKDIIVVIPTADYNGKFAKECRENIFKGLHIIFVESGNRGDFYFNFAHYSNVGIKKAMEYNPKWIVFSNDDMISDYPASVLKEQIMMLRQDVDYALPKNETREDVGNRFFLCTLTLTGKIILKAVYYFSKLIPRTISLKLAAWGYSKFKQEFFVIPTKTKRKGWKLLFRVKKEYYNFADFIILNRNLLNLRYPLFNESFVNGNEDVDLSLFLRDNNFKAGVIDYSIKGIGGWSLGMDDCRAYRNLAGSVMLSEEVEKAKKGK
ncbi:MAG: hypothetical protein QXU98_05435 [Candidatus Parvarchaeota archaeon]